MQYQKVSAKNLENICFAKHLLVAASEARMILNLFLKCGMMFFNKKVWFQA